MPQSRHLPAAETPSLPTLLQPPLTRGVWKKTFFYTNKYRKSKGPAPLELSETVSVQAREHSRDMAKGRTGFGHRGFEERIDDISKKMGSVKGAAENVAYGTLDAEAVVKGWINSPGHRKNLEGNYNVIGIGTADKGRITFFTQIFINKPKTAAPAGK
ncbi:CAP domain-containing protein [Chitinophaga sedimenti]|uniref:CAP domain-containing protein n=1 Tax=Chitinophaga sedimenti TaxID=2033606 RepID=UPI002002BE82|nr:CAP domain-containing protein [Chitinophaga sedimenti]MCK7554557.1 CAP domain-containing protein [Chitinophaga sedimenti]